MKKYNKNSTKAFSRLYNCEVTIDHTHHDVDDVPILTCSGHDNNVDLLSEHLGHKSEYGKPFTGHLFRVTELTNFN